MLNKQRLQAVTLKVTRPYEAVLLPAAPVFHGILRPLEGVYLGFLHRFQPERGQTCILCWSAAGMIQPVCGGSSLGDKVDLWLQL